MSDSTDVYTFANYFLKRHDGEIRTTDLPMLVRFLEICKAKDAHKLEECLPLSVVVRRLSLHHWCSPWVRIINSISLSFFSLNLHFFHQNRTITALLIGSHSVGRQTVVAMHLLSLNLWSLMDSTMKRVTMQMLCVAKL